MDIKNLLLEKIKESKKDVFTMAEVNVFSLLLNVSKDEIQKCVTELVQEYNLMKEGNKVFLPEKRGYIRGRIMTSKSGKIYLRPDSGAEDLEVPASFSSGALNKDVVLARVMDGGRGNFRRGATQKQARVEKIISHGVESIVGTFKKNGIYGYVVPLDESFKQEIAVSASSSANAKVGQIVNVKINKFGGVGQMGDGEILEILGYPNDRGVDILAVAREHGLTEKFPEAVIAEAETLPDSVDRTKYPNRRYFNENIITIDGEDTRDIDDAISLVREGENFRLFVHIADVNEYVKEGGELDKEAFTRGTSVYFPDFVIPMFPIKLSNGICSLFEGVDRCTLTCEMLIDKNGKVLDYDVYESIINSNHRMTYDQVQKILDGDEQERAKFADVAPMLDDMNELGKILYSMREKRGALDFDISEAYIKVDENGKTVDILKRPRRDSDKIIESFMIAANESVADKFKQADMPFVYRIHENPNEIKVKKFAEWCAGFGEKFQIKGDIDNNTFQTFLKKMDEKDYGPILEKLALRTMQKAKYSPNNLGHFGLGSPCYCHFTSPIRRYPDLAVHRMIKMSINGELYTRDIDELNKYVFEAAEQSSERERNADDAEREVDDMKKAEYMQQFVGKEFEGLVSGLTEFGVFVELDNTCEGRISLVDMEGKWNFNEDRQMVTGPDGVFRLGRKVKVKLLRADPSSKEIDFEFVSFLDREKNFDKNREQNNAKIVARKMEEKNSFSKKNKKMKENSI